MAVMSAALERPPKSIHADSTPLQLQRRAGRRLTAMAAKEGKPISWMVGHLVTHRWSALCSLEVAGEEEGNRAPARRNRRAGRQAGPIGGKKNDTSGSKSSGRRVASLLAASENATVPFTPDGPGRRVSGRAQLLPLEPLRALVQIADRTDDRRLLVSWTTGGEFAKMALNLALSVRANVPSLETSMAMISLDEDAHALLQGHGFSSVLLPGPQTQEAIKDPWQNDDLWKLKYRLVASLIELGLSALVVDTDVVFLSDPFVALVRDADLEVMTDFFFPADHLLDTSMRSEDNINTGYMFHTASTGVQHLMMAFLDACHLKTWQGLLRDWFNQRVFNKFILEWIDAGLLEVRYKYRSWTSLRSGNWTNAGGVVASHSDSGQQHPPMVVIRILDPAFVAHGMNFFWRRAHLLPPELPGYPGADSAHGLVAVHANGVEPKDYFMRDRGLWLIDEFADRFGESPLFLTYTQPRNLSLGEDFEVLAAALDLAIMLKRRVVLPTTMNCRNCPAYLPYGMANWPLSSEGLLLGCTFDYFSRAGIVTGEWLNFAVESSVTTHPEFVALRPRMRMRTVRQFQQEVEKARGGMISSIYSKVAVLEIIPDVRSVRDVLKAASGGAALDTLPCAFRAWPATTYSCRDTFLVPATGQSAELSSSVHPHGGLVPSRIGPSTCDGTAQSECAVLPFLCCEVFFGWADKLESLAIGAPPWDLPCGCGLSHHCQRVDSGGQACCTPRAAAAARRFGQQCGPHLPAAQLPRQIPDDADTYSSSTLRALARGLITRSVAEDLCLVSSALHRQEVGPQARRFCQKLLDTYLGALRGYANPLA